MGVKVGFATHLHSEAPARGELYTASRHLRKKHLCRKMLELGDNKTVPR